MIQKVLLFFFILKPLISKELSYSKPDYQAIVQSNDESHIKRELLRDLKSLNEGSTYYQVNSTWKSLALTSTVHASDFLQSLRLSLYLTKTYDLSPFVQRLETPFVSQGLMQKIKPYLSYLKAREYYKESKNRFLSALVEENVPLKDSDLVTANGKMKIPGFIGIYLEILLSWDLKLFRLFKNLPPLDMESERFYSGLKTKNFLALSKLRSLPEPSKVLSFLLKSADLNLNQVGLVLALRGFLRDPQFLALKVLQTNPRLARFLFKNRELFQKLPFEITSKGMEWKFMEDQYGVLYFKVFENYSGQNAFYLSEPITKSHYSRITGEKFEKNCRGMQRGPYLECLNFYDLTQFFHTYHKLSVNPSRLVYERELLTFQKLKSLSPYSRDLKLNLWTAEPYFEGNTKHLESKSDSPYKLYYKDSQRKSTRLDRTLPGISFLIRWGEEGPPLKPRKTRDY